MGDDRFELLLEVERVADGAGWPGEAPDQLVALIVPRVADACTLDIVDESGDPQRLAAHYEGPGGPELAAYLAARRPTREQTELTVAALRAGRPRVISIDAASLRAIAHDDDEARWLSTMDLAHWVNLPLQVSDQLLGSLGLGLSPARPAPDEQLPFLQALAERAARGFANTQLISELRRTRQRLERILGVLAEAVTVHDEAGKLVYANAAAVSLLGAESVEELLAAEPGELAAALHHHARGRHAGAGVRPAGAAAAGGRGRADAAHPQHRAADRPRVLAAHQGDAARRRRDARRQHHRGRHRGEDRGAPPALPRRGRRAAGLLAATTSRRSSTSAALVVPTLADWCALDLVDETGDLQRVALVHHDSGKRRLADDLHKRYPPQLGTDQGLAAVLLDGRSMLVPAITDDMLELAARDPEHLRLLRELGMRSAMLVALAGHDETIGVLTLVNSDSHRTFDEGDLAFAEEVARRAASAVAGARARAD